MGLFDWHRLWAEPERDPLPIYDEESAIAYVRALGYAVIKAQQPPVPRIGECWVPQRGRSKRRWVRSVGTAQMSYALTEDGLPVTVALSTWHRWRQGFRAVKL